MNFGYAKTIEKEFSDPRKKVTESDTLKKRRLPDNLRFTLAKLQKALGKI